MMLATISLKCPNILFIEILAIRATITLISCFTGLEVVGAKVTAIKRAADYPALNGAWKTDPKFIGVR